MSDNFKEKIRYKLSNLPYIKRAKGYHLYTYSNVRILDMYLEGNVFGYRLEGILHDLKNNLSKGNLTSYPHQSKSKISSFILSFFPKGYVIKYFLNKQSLFLNLKKLKINLKEDYFDSYNPKLKVDNYNILQYRIFDNIPDYKENNIVIAFYPIPNILTFQVLLIPQSLQDSFESEDIPIVSLYYLSSILGYYKKILNFDPKKPRPKHYKLGKNLKYFCQNHYNSFDITQNFNIDNCYIVFKKDEKSYEKIFWECLKNNILLNPYYKGASILPSLVSDSEKKKIEALLNFDYKD